MMEICVNPDKVPKRGRTDQKKLDLGIRHRGFGNAH